MTSWANAVLHETASAFSNVVFPPGPHALPDQFFSSFVVFGSLRLAGPGTTVVGV